MLKVPPKRKVRIAEATEGFYVDDHEVDGEIPEEPMELKLTLMLVLLQLLSDAPMAVRAQMKLG